jgi:hypothetical protein
VEKQKQQQQQQQHFIAVVCWLCELYQREHATVEVIAEC